MARQKLKVKNIDIITSALNEELCIQEFIDRVRKTFSALSNYRYRMIIVDNGSSDSTLQRIKERVSDKGDILCIKMSRTFPFDSALTCGLDKATGDYAIIMASDLQDPPETIKSLLETAEEGYDQVLVKVTKRKSVPFLRRSLSRFYYKLANQITLGTIPENISDFRLLSQKAYQASRNIRERHRFLRGINAWIGFKTTFIEIERPARFAGKSKWLGDSLFRILAQGTSSILGFSIRPLSWIAFSAFSLALFCIFMIPVLYFFWNSKGVPFAGFGSILSLLLIVIALLLTSLAVISMYLSIIFEEVKKRPLYVIDETFGSKD